MEDFKRFALERLEEARKNIEDLEKLIQLGKETGMNISQYLVKLEGLKREYERWRKALEKIG